MTYREARAASIRAAAIGCGISRGEEGFPPVKHGSCNSESGGNQDLVCYLEELLVAKKSLKTLDHAGDIGLGHGPTNAHLARFLHKLPRHVHGEHQDRNHGDHSTQFTGSLKPIHAGHEEIKDDHIRVQLLDTVYRIATVCSFANHVPVGMLLQKILQALAHQGTVVDY
jgi:hypothetical protein